jgi:hypothetical protein
VRGNRQFHKEELLGVVENSPQGGFNSVFWGEVELEGVDILLILVQLKVKVRPCRSTGRADIADDLALFHGDALANSTGYSL